MLVSPAVEGAAAAGVLPKSAMVWRAGKCMSLFDYTVVDGGGASRGLLVMVAAVERERAALESRSCGYSEWRFGDR